MKNIWPPELHPAQGILHLVRNLMRASQQRCSLIGLHILVSLYCSQAAHVLAKPYLACAAITISAQHKHMTAPCLHNVCIEHNLWGGSSQYTRLNKQASYHHMSNNGWATCQICKTLLKALV